MKFTKHPLFLWALNLFILGSIGFFIRALFCFFLSPSDLQLSENYPDLFRAFLQGFRFDLSALAYLTLLFVPFTLFKKTPTFIYRTGLNIYRVLVYFWITISIIDILFYSFYADRFNIIAFGFLDDETGSLMKILWKNYPAVKIAIVVMLLCLTAYWSTRRLLDDKKLEILQTSRKSKVLLIVSLMLMARGTLSLFPLGADYAVISTVPFLNHLSFGTGHALIRATKLRVAQNKMGADHWDSNLKEFGYAGQEDKAFEDYFNRTIPKGSDRYDLMKHKSPAASENDQIKNVILVVMESWGAYGVLNQRQNPRFDLIGKMQKHFDQDFMSVRFLANTQGTAGSLSCLLGGIPQRAISPFLTESVYLNTRLSTSPALTYKKRNYETHFLYGGNPGWRDINKYAKAQGFDFIEGEIEVKKVLKENNIPSAGSHDWGIFDEDLFHFIQLKLSEKSNTKKLFVVMTTTNHPPFELPQTYDAKSVENEIQSYNYPQYSRLMEPELAQERFRTYRYSSDKLGEFMNQIKQGPLASNTLVAATGDHSSWLVNFRDNERFVKDIVPLYIYIPSKLVESRQLKTSEFKEIFGSHMDIWPTLYNLSLNNVEYETFGRDIFAATEQPFALNASKIIVSGEYAAVVHNGSRANYYQTPPTAEEARDLFVDSPQKNIFHERLEKKYRSLMGTLDLYLHKSKAID